MGDYHAFVQARAVHSGHSFTQAGSNPTIAAQGFVSTTRLRFENPAFNNTDAAVNISKDAWNARLYAENLSDSHTSLLTNADQFIVAQTPCARGSSECDSPTLSGIRRAPPASPPRL